MRGQQHRRPPLTGGAGGGGIHHRAEERACQALLLRGGGRGGRAADGSFGDAVGVLVLDQRSERVVEQRGPGLRPLPLLRAPPAVAVNVRDDILPRFGISNLSRRDDRNAVRQCFEGQLQLTVAGHARDVVAPANTWTLGDGYTLSWRELAAGTFREFYMTESVLALSDFVPGSRRGVRKSHRRI